MAGNKNARLPWPQGLIVKAFGDDDPSFFEDSSWKGINNDQMDGLLFALNDLKELEKKTLLLRFKEHKTLEEIADHLHCSRSWVSAVIAKTIRKLRHPSRSRPIRYGMAKVSELKQRELEERRLQILIRRQKILERVRSMQSVEEKMVALSDINLYDGGLSEEIIKKLRHSSIYMMTQLIEAVFSNPQKLNDNNKLSMDNIDEIIDLLCEYGLFSNGKKQKYGQRQRYIEQYFDAGQEVSNTELSFLFKCNRIGKFRETRDTKDLIIIANYNKKVKDEWKDGILYLRCAKIPLGQNVPGVRNNRLEKKLKSDIKVYLFETIDKEKYTYRGRIQLAGDPFMKTRRSNGGILRYTRVFPMRLIPECNT